MRKVRIIEPLIVFPQNGESDGYSLLDGPVRLEVLKEIGVTHARCLISTDDETCMYDKRVNRIAAIQEHMMILYSMTCRWTRQSNRGSPQENTTCA